MVNNQTGTSSLLAWRIFIWSIGLSPAILTFFWPRSAELSSYLDKIDSFGAGTELAEYVGKALTFVMLAISTYFSWRFRDRLLTPRLSALLWASCLLLAAGLFLGGAFGTAPGLTGGMLLYLTALSAACAIPPTDMESLVGEIKAVLRVYLYGSLVAALIAPYWAMTIPYTEGYIPGFEVRLHGIIVHGIQLAYLLSILVLLELAFPSKVRWLVRFSEFFLLLSCLALTQAKTMWVLLPIGLISLWTVGRSYGLGQQRLSLGTKTAALAWLVFFLSAAYFSFGISWMFDLLGDGAEKLSSLTGRTTIWAITLDLWRENPWFGYGPWLWDFDMGLANVSAVGMAPGQSHNQFVQSLGQSGLVGLATLIFHLVVLVGFAYGTRVESRGVILAVTAVCILRGLSEAWIRRGVTDGNLFIHVCIVAMISVALSARAKSPSIANDSPTPLS